MLLVTRSQLQLWDLVLQMTHNPQPHPELNLSLFLSLFSPLFFSRDGAGAPISLDSAFSPYHIQRITQQLPTQQIKCYPTKKYQTNFQIDNELRLPASISVHISSAKWTAAQTTPSIERGVMPLDLNVPRDGRTDNCLPRSPKER